MGEAYLAKAFGSEYILSFSFFDSRGGERTTEIKAEGERGGKRLSKKF